MRKSFTLLGRIMVTFFLAILMMFECGAEENVTRPLTLSQEGALSPSLLKEIRNELHFSSDMKVRLNAVTNNKIRHLALNRELVSNYNKLYSNKIKTGKITDQQRSGRCWLFAALNIMRPVICGKLKIDDFEFSQNYLFFWDKMEKANIFLESIIATRNKDTKDKKVKFLLEEPFADGGQWNYAAELINKYGLIPRECMEETENTADSTMMDLLASTLLRKDASILRKMHSCGKSENELRQKKSEMLKQIYQVLVMFLGVPPESFEFRYENRDKKVSAPRKYSPIEFYREVVAVNLDDYVCFYSSPTWPYNRLYQIDLDRNMVEKPNITFINAEIKDLKVYTLKSILADEPVWFAADIDKDADRFSGMMAKDLFNYQEILGVSLEMTKLDRILYYDTSANHAMIIKGVDIVAGKPVKWLVENSWGKDRGDEGYFSMHDNWFDEFVYEAVLNKKYIPAPVLEILKLEPVVLPEDDQMRALVIGK